MTFRLTQLILISVLLANSAVAGDWLQFRGPNGSGISADEASVPKTWSPKENIKWKTAVPGAGVSSPIVVGDRVFVTCYTGYGMDRGNPGNIEDLKRHIVCFDRNSGSIEWNRAVDAVQPEDPFTGMGVPAHGYASHTPISDGERVYVFFGKTGAIAFDLDGNQLWKKGVGTESDPRLWGSSSSPVLYKDTLIVTASAESQAVVGLDTKTGEERWRQEAAGLDNVWGTPVLVKVSEDLTELVLGVPYEIWGFNPDNGKLRWYCQAMETDQFNSSVVASDGVVYAIEGRGGGSIAVRAGGKGDVTESEVVWSGRDSSRFGTPVVFKNRLYYFSNGVVHCIDARTRDRVYRGRLTRDSSSSRESNDDRRRDRRRGVRGGFEGFGRGGGTDYSSPVIADNKLYYVRRNGDTFVLGIDEEFEQLAVNRVTEDSESFAATPAVSNGQIFIRSSEQLYCIALE